jgi:PAS domain S-box-containing protein
VLVEPPAGAARRGRGLALISTATTVAPRVLIVEDDDAHALLLARHFEDHQPQLRLSRVASLKAARASLAAEAPDLVIADLRLPDGSGSELLEPGAGYARVPLVVMTSFGDQQIAVEAMRRGALDYVVKSETTLAQMPRIAERALREWGHVVERDRAEEALRESEAHFRSLIENGLDLIALVDAGAVLRYVSPSVERLLGWEAETLVGRSWLDLVHPDEGETARRILADAVATPDSRQYALIRLRSRSGEWLSFETIAGVRHEGRAAPQVVLNARDVSERLRAERAHRELEAQLLQAQKLETLGTLAGGIAHDFNNILQAIVGCTELALGQLGDDSPARRFLDRSLEVSRRARDLVRQIVQFARQGDLRREPVRLDALVEEVCRLLRAALPATVAVHERIEEKGAVLGDATQIHQVLMNLATNALQAMGDAGGTLEIAVERHQGRAEPGADQPPGGSHLVLSVSDTGPGIPPDVQERIFEPFFTTRRVGGGTGLGLSVAHGIVKSHGGAIVCRSEPGRGTVFRVFLPEAVTPGAQAARELPPDSPPQQARLLFVDDDENVVFVGRSVLEGLGHEVTTAREGLEALELFRREPAAFDAAVVDELMPGMTGSQLATELRRIRPGLPIVIASGHGLPAHARFEDDAGVLYLAKPFEWKELAGAIEAVLGRRGLA